MRLYIFLCTFLQVLLVGCGSERSSRPANNAFEGARTVLRARDDSPIEIDEPSCGKFAEGNQVIVCDRSGRSIALFDSSGKEHWRFGRQGRGPGEFREITSLVRDDLGRISIFDAQNKKLVVVDQDGQLLSDRSASFLDGWMPLYIGSLGDGRLVFLRSTSGAPPLGLANAIVPVRTTIIAIDTARAIQTTLDTITLFERFVFGQGVGGVTVGLPLSPEGRAAVVAGQIVTAFGADSFLVRKAVASTSPETLVVAHPARLVTSADWELAVKSRIAGTPSDFRERVSTALSRVHQPKHFPRFRSMVASTKGTIAILVPSMDREREFTIVCAAIASGETCPTGVLRAEDELLAIASGKALVAIQRDEGTYELEIWQTQF